jgi:hypothetical protein
VDGFQLVNLRLMGWPSFPWQTISPPSSFRQFLINLKNITHLPYAAVPRQYLYMRAGHEDLT